MMRINSNVRTVHSPDGGALLDLQRGKIFRVNGIGAIVLELLAAGNSEESIALEISKRCAVELQTATADVRAFLASLEDNALLADDCKS